MSKLHPSLKQQTKEFWSGEKRAGGFKVGVARFWHDGKRFLLFDRFKKYEHMIHIINPNENFERIS